MKLKKVMLVAAMPAATVLAAAPSLARGGSGSGGGAGSGDGSASQIPAPADETPAAEAGWNLNAPAQQYGKLPNLGGISPVALASVAVLISGAALGVVALRRCG